jgi:hypothetical protein
LIPAFYDEMRMGPKTPVTEGDFFRQPLREQINLKDPLVGLANLISWDRLGTSMSERFVSSMGRLAPHRDWSPVFCISNMRLTCPTKKSCGNEWRTRIG